MAHQPDFGHPGQVIRRRVTPGIFTLAAVGFLSGCAAGQGWFASPTLLCDHPSCPKPNIQLYTTKKRIEKVADSSNTLTLRDARYCSMIGDTRIIVMTDGEIARSAAAPVRDVFKGVASLCQGSSSVLDGNAVFASVNIQLLGSRETALLLGDRAKLTFHIRHGGRNTLANGFLVDRDRPCDSETAATQLCDDAKITRNEPKDKKIQCTPRLDAGGLDPSPGSYKLCVTGDFTRKSPDIDEASMTGEIAFIDVVQFSVSPTVFFAAVPGSAKLTCLGPDGSAICQGGPSTKIWFHNAASGTRSCGPPPSDTDRLLVSGWTGSQAVTGVTASDTAGSVLLCVSGTDTSRLDPSTGAGVQQLVVAKRPTLKLKKGEAPPTLVRGVPHELELVADSFLTHVFVAEAGGSSPVCAVPGASSPSQALPSPVSGGKAPVVVKAGSPVPSPRVTATTDTDGTRLCLVARGSAVVAFHNSSLSFRSFRSRHDPLIASRSAELSIDGDVPDNTIVFLSAAADCSAASSSHSTVKGVVDDFRQATLGLHDWPDTTGMDIGTRYLCLDNSRATPSTVAAGLAKTAVAKVTLHPTPSATEKPLRGETHDPMRVVEVTSVPGGVVVWVSGEVSCGSARTPTSKNAAPAKGGNHILTFKVDLAAVGNREVDQLIPICAGYKNSEGVAHPVKIGSVNLTREPPKFGAEIIGSKGPACAPDLALLNGEVPGELRTSGSRFALVVGTSRQALEAHGAGVCCRRYNSSSPSADWSELVEVVNVGLPDDNKIIKMPLTNQEALRAAWRNMQKRVPDFDRLGYGSSMPAEVCGLIVSTSEPVSSAEHTAHFCHSITPGPFNLSVLGCQPEYELDTAALPPRAIRGSMTPREELGLSWVLVILLVALFLLCLLCLCAFCAYRIVKAGSEIPNEDGVIGIVRPPVEMDLPPVDEGFDRFLELEDAEEEERARVAKAEETASLRILATFARDEDAWLCNAATVGAEREEAEALEEDGRRQIHAMEQQTRREMEAAETALWSDAMAREEAALGRAVDAERALRASSLPGPAPGASIGRESVLQSPPPPSALQPQRQSIVPPTSAAYQRSAYNDPYASGATSGSAMQSPAWPLGAAAPPPRAAPSGVNTDPYAAGPSPSPFNPHGRPVASAVPAFSAPPEAHPYPSYGGSRFVAPQLPSGDHAESPSKKRSPWWPAPAGATSVPVAGAENQSGFLEGVSSP